MPLKGFAYRLGDLIIRDSVMGVVTLAEGRMVTIQFVDGVNSINHTTVNITKKQYLRVVKSQRGIIARNITLENEIVSEATKNNNVEGVEQ